MSDVLDEPKPFVVVMVEQLVNAMLRRVDVGSEERIITLPPKVFDKFIEECDHLGWIITAGHFSYFWHGITIRRGKE